MKITPTFLILLFPVWGFSNPPSKNLEDDFSADIHASPNIAKFNLTSLAFKTFSFQYERIVDRKMSIALGFRFMPGSNLPFKSSILSFVDKHDTFLNTMIKGTKVGGYAFTPEFRYYLSKSANHGFYIGSFVRYENFKINSTYLLDGSVDITSIHLKGNLSVMGIGLMLGAQFKLTNRIMLDWWILGPYYTSNTFNLSANNFKLSNSDRDQFQETLDDAEIPGLKLSSIVSNTAVHLKANGGFAAIRGLGICLGYKF